MLVSGQIQDPPGGATGDRTALDLTSEGNRRLAHARELVAAHAYDAALAELLWCFDRCRSERAFWSTRLGPVLDVWAALARVHPPARTQMIQRRDAQDRAVRTGALGNGDVAELLALNDVLGEMGASVRTFDAVVPVRSSQELEFFFEGVREELWRQRRYRTLVERRPHPEVRLQTAAVALREATKRLVGRAMQPDPSYTTKVVEDVCLDIEARIALDDRGADGLIAAVRQFSPGRETEALLVAHAARAGDAAAVARLRGEVERGLDDQGKASFARLVEAAKATLRARAARAAG